MLAMFLEIPYEELLIYILHLPLVGRCLLAAPTEAVKTNEKLQREKLKDARELKCLANAHAVGKLQV
jgi:hypothetical protein